MAGLFSVVPIIGGIITNFTALILAFMINYGSFIRTIICILLLSIVDGYIISPFIYKKINKIHPVLSIFMIFVCGKIFGLFGTIIALPLLILFLNIYRFLKV